MKEMQNKEKRKIEVREDHENHFCYNIIKKNQSSLEMLVIVGFGMLLLAPMIYYAVSYHTDIREAKEMITAKRTLEKMREYAMEVYAQGEGSKSTFSIILPSSMTYFNIEKSHYIVMRLNLSYGENDIFVYLPFNITASSLPQKGGNYIVKVISTGEGVIYEFSTE